MVLFRDDDFKIDQKYDYYQFGILASELILQTLYDNRKIYKDMEKFRSVFINNSIRIDIK